MEKLLLDLAKKEGFSNKVRAEVFGSGLEDGSNFHSNLLKGTISEDERCLRVVIKKEVPCPEINSREKFTNEIHFYTRIYPQLKAFGDVPKVPRYLWSSEEDTGAIVVLEDLTEEGYAAPVVDRALNEEEVALVLKELDKLHRTSKAMRERNPGLFELLASNLKEGYCFGRPYEGVLAQCVNNAMTAASRYLPPKYKDKLESFDFARIKEWTMMKDTEGAVITHGDSWFSNFMFKYEEGRPSSVAILDWQMCRVGSPLLDISEFLLTSSSAVPCPSAPECAFGLAMAITIFPFFLGQADPRYVLTPERLVFNENEAAWKKIAEVVKIAVDAGIL